ncbi:MAG: hypothetical protein L0Z62_04895, partial [Gemmataceae bacterium]|nr:hypothetical protein [Gemmataceae bacterium]
MQRIMVGLVVLLLAWPAAADDDKPKDKAPDKPGTPAAKYQALVKEYNDAQQAFFREYQKATDEAKPKLVQEKMPKPEKYAPKFLELVETHPKDPAAVDALVWVATHVSGRPSDKDSSRAKALAILLQDHVTSDKLGGVCQRLTRMDPTAEALLRGILEKNPSPEVQGDACLALAQGLRQQIEPLRMLARNPDFATRYEQALGKETLDRLKQKDLAKVEAESEQLFQRFADKYVTHMKPERLANLFQRLSYSADKGAEKLLRTLLEKDTRRETQGVACLTLAQILKRQADGLPA